MRNDNIKFRDIFWNTIGTVTYAMISLLLSVVVIRMCGKIEGGIFSFGFSTLAHLAYIVAYFGIRPMHIVDIRYRYSFSDYLKFSIKSSIVALCAGTIYILFMYGTGNYTLFKFLILLVLIMHGTLDGLSDCYESEYQRVNRLYMCGQSLFFRIIAFLIALIVTLHLTNNLLLSEIVSLVVEIVFFYFFNISRSKNIFKTAKLDGANDKSRNIMIEALPLFLITFLDMFIFTQAKFAIDINLGDTYSGFYNLLFMPTNVIYLVMTLFMKPLLTPLSNAYHTDKAEYNKILFNTFLLSLAIALIFIVGTILLGNIYLNLIGIVTNGEYIQIGTAIVYNSFKLEFIVLLTVIIGGCFYTICTPMYFAIIIEDKQRYLLIIYGIIAVLSVYISREFVVSSGIIGAAISFVVSMFLLFVGVIAVKALTK